MPWARRRLADGILGCPCRLVRNHEAYARQTHSLAAHLFLPVQRRYPDYAPILLAGNAALAELGQRADFKLEMSRFRPNLVIDGGEPYAEDYWRTIRICNINFKFMGPCERCDVTLVIPESDMRSHKPLLTSRTYRKVPSVVA